MCLAGTALIVTCHHTVRMVQLETTKYSIGSFPIEKYANQYFNVVGNSRIYHMVP